MVKVFGVPVQPAATGVTVMVAVTGVLPVFLTVKAGIFPQPLAAKPIDVLLFVQLNAVPKTVLLNATGLDCAPLHTD